MGDRLNLLQIAVLTAYSLGMAAGQILFKFAAIRSNPSRSLGDRLFDLSHDVYFLAALLIYAGLSVLWVWVLTHTPLSRAYPFVALAFVLTPHLGSLFFDEPITVRLLGGIALILGGLFLVAT